MTLTQDSAKGYLQKTAVHAYALEAPTMVSMQVGVRALCPCTPESDTLCHACACVIQRRCVALCGGRILTHYDCVVDRNGSSRKAGRYDSVRRRTRILRHLQERVSNHVFAHERCVALRSGGKNHNYREAAACELTDSHVAPRHGTQVRKIKQSAGAAHVQAVCRHRVGGRRIARYGWRVPSAGAPPCWRARFGCVCVTDN